MFYVGKNANGEGSITYDKRRRRHRVRVPIETLQGTVRKHVGWFKTRDEAHAALVEVLSKNGRRRISLDAGKVSVADYLRDWLENTARVNVSGDVFALYGHEVREYLIPYIGALRLADLRSLHVRVAKQELLDRGYAEATVAHALGTLSSALNQAVEDELIPTNPARSVRRPKKRGEVMRILSEEHIARLLSHVATHVPRLEAFYQVATKLGPRSGELSALLREDLDLREHTLTIRRSVQTRRAGAQWSATKSGEERTILLPPSVEDSLQRHLKRQAEERLKARSWGDPRLLFPNTRGDVYRRSSIHQDFVKILSAAGLPRVRFHDLRHTSVTLMLRHGVDVRTVADIHGHADPAMTLRRYSHVLPSMQQRAAQIVDSYGF